MDKIWDRKSFKVRGHWPLWRRTDKSRTPLPANGDFSVVIYPLHIILQVHGLSETLVLQPI